MEITASVDSEMDALAERIVALLEKGEARIVDFAVGAGQGVIRAVCYRGDDGAP
jgi:hypothetical protein